MLIPTLLAAALAASVPPAAVVDDPVRPPAGWAVVGQPTDEAGWTCANRFGADWSVRGQSARVASISPHQHWDEVTIDVAGGRLIGIDNGEFGGSIKWQPPKAKRVLIATANPVAFTRRGDDVFVASGLAHLGMDTGEILRLRRTADGSWKSSTALDLGEAPNAAYRKDETTWIVLSNHGVTKVDLAALTKQQLYRNPNWWRLHGNSITPLGDAWLIGARRAVIRLSPSAQGYQEDWLVPENCQRMVGADCGCQAGGQGP